MAAQPTIIEETKQRQLEDEFLKKVHGDMETKPRPGFSLEGQVLKLKGRLCVFNVPEIKGRVLEESSQVQICYASQKYQNVPRSQESFLVAQYEKRNCEVHFKMPSMSTSKSGIPKTSGVTSSSSYSGMEIRAHNYGFITIYNADRLATVYIAKIIRLHSILVSIVLDRESKFVSRFWQSLQKALGMELRFSTAFHPQTDGQSERII
ncbi:uncharacterized protein LOC114282166 [Camellia sinensis]|uniref:uncharacterized protein LOC114282166 n=1 Tax=Camellia sinensis TaxID=4442 RepID=UPI00103590DF|nr:uncharacterized protein LOC114282166 [Camellia sinensis]